MTSSPDKKTINNVNAEVAKKILSAVPYDKGFHFFMTDGHYTGESATSLATFSKDLEREEIQSIRFHFDRGDFQKWIKTTIGDEELAARIDKMGTKDSDETLRKKLVEVLQKRLSELQQALES